MLTRKQPFTDTIASKSVGNQIERYNYSLTQTIIDEYVSSLKLFSTSTGLARLLTPPVDHFAVKLRDTKSFESYLNSIKPFCLELSYIKMNDRKIATARLTAPHLFENLGKCDILEIMEPRPEKSGKEPSKFDHIEVYNPNLAELEGRLGLLGIAYQPYQNPGHKALVLVINPQGQEIKFTDNHLLEIVKLQNKQGQGIEIKL